MITMKFMAAPAMILFMVILETILSMVTKMMTRYMAVQVKMKFTEAPAKIRSMAMKATTS